MNTAPLHGNKFDNSVCLVLLFDINNIAYVLTMNDTF